MIIMKTNISARAVYIVPRVLLFGLCIYKWTLATGSLRTTTLHLADCPSLISKTKVDCRWISPKLVSMPSCRTANLTCLGLHGNKNMEMYQAMCALNQQYTLMLNQYTNSDKECSWQLLNFQDCTDFNQTNRTSALWNNPPICSSPLTAKITEEIAVNKRSLRKRQAEDSLSLIVTSPNDDFIIYFTLANKNPVKMSLNAFAIDYDPLEDRVYFTAQYGTSIYSAFSNGTDKAIIATAEIDTKPRGIAVDSLSRLLFYSEENKGYIALINMSSFHHKIVINNGLIKPGALAINILDSTLCWIDNGTKKIECAKYDGSERRDVVNSDLHNPFGLALDATNKYIYWSDGNQLERCDLDGRDRKVIHSTAPTSRFNGLSLSASHLYAIQYVTGEVLKSLSASELYAIQYVTGAAAVRSYVYRYGSDNTSQTKIFEDSSQLYDIHILSSVVSKGHTICESSHHGCSHICIPITVNKSKCLCPDELSLGMDEKTCYQNMHSETFIIPVIVGTVITLLVTIGVSVLVIKRGWLCFAKRSEGIETSAVRDVDADDGRPTSSNKNSEIYDEIVDEDLTTTHPHGEEESNYLDHYNVMDNARVSPECSVMLISEDNIKSFVQCGLDTENYIIPVSNDGYLNPICKSHYLHAVSDEKDDYLHAVSNEKDNYLHAVSDEKDDYLHAVSNEKDNYLHAVSDEKDDYLHAVSDEKDDYLHAVSDEKDDYLHAVSNEKDNYLHAVSDEKDNYLHAVSNEKDNYLHTVNNEKDNLLHAVNNEKDSYLHAVNNEKDNYLHAVSDEKDNYLHAVSNEKDNYLHAVSDEKDNYLHAVSNEKDNYLHTVSNEKDNYLHAVSNEKDNYLHAISDDKDYFSHLDSDTCTILDPNVNKHTEYASESVSYLTLPSQCPDILSCTQPLRNDRITSEEFPDESESNPYASLKSKTDSENSDDTSSTSTESNKDVTF